VVLRVVQLQQAVLRVVTLLQLVLQAVQLPLLQLQVVVHQVVTLLQEHLQAAEHQAVELQQQVEKAHYSLKCSEKWNVSKSLWADKSPALLQISSFQIRSVKPRSLFLEI
jgi:hypothetical protein